MKTRIAIYAGSFDPLTLGHYDVISRSSRLFDEVIVAIGVSQGKKPLFDTHQRQQMIEEVCEPLKNVRCDSFSGLIADYACSVSAIALVRGLRTEDDFTYEMQMAMMNRNLQEELETIFIPTSQIFSHISSSLVKEVASYGGRIDKLVPPLIEEKLKSIFKKK